MIENNPTNVVAAFEMLLEEVEAEIDDRVYRLYGLTPAEIKLVEESAKG